MTTTHEPHPETASTDSSWWSEVGWVHLVYLAFLIPQPIYDPESGLWDWVLVVGIVLVFLPLYVFAWVRPDLARWGSVVPMTALGVVTTPLNSGAAVLFVYAAAIAGVRESRRIALRWFIGLTVVLCVLVSFSPVPLPQRLWGLGPPLVFIWIIGLTQIEQAERDREAAELRLRNARVEHLATVSERERIARELHDLLGHSLTSMIMHAQLCQNLVEVDPARAREAAAKAERTARAALTEVLIVTTFARSGYLRRAMDAGVTGYVLKDAPIGELADALRKVHAGGTVVSAELALAAWDHSDQLTDRERELLRQVADGATNRDIARRLHLAEGTVRNYLSAAMAKLGARNRTEAAKAARERGWI